ncbi:hypothetical protein GH714_030114 [Hevea brasiliensis]|uniref:Uncharacterized protein n=1 Tax=Hevea brasiliensis TaxID=3981 RepID=A0A6A6MR03_HEVBR|nr:hypothetical protein GH714_030114 [Hevea brasiliensis]
MECGKVISNHHGNRDALAQSGLSCRMGALSGWSSNLCSLRMVSVAQTFKIGPNTVVQCITIYTVGRKTILPFPTIPSMEVGRIYEQSGQQILLLEHFLFWRML